MSREGENHVVIALSINSHLALTLPYADLGLDGGIREVNHFYALLSGSTV